MSEDEEKTGLACRVLISSVVRMSYSVCGVESVV